MRRFLILGVGVALLAAASVAWSAAGGDGPQQDRLAGGGVFGPGCSDGATPFCIAAARSFSIDAAASPDGGGAYGTYLSGRTGAGETALIGRITCLRVEGGSAVAGGYVVGGTSAVGVDVFFIYMQDRAAPGVGSDGVSANFLDVANSAGLPTGFPNECPPVDNGAFDRGYFTLDGGDVQVTDK